MLLLAEQLEFEQAAKLRDRIQALESDEGATTTNAPARPASKSKRSSRRR
jgi:excinuclease UvrABC nuclease subunit